MDRWRQGASGLLAAMLLTAGLAACGDDDSAGPETGADVEDIAEDEGVAAGDGGEGGGLAEQASSFVGEQVTVSATINEIVSPAAFVIGDNAPLLVLSAPAADFAAMGFEPTDEMVSDEAVVQVTGTVRSLDIAGFEEEFGVDYDDALFEPFEGQNVIVADRVATLTGQEVTVAGEVETVLSTVAFRLSGVGWDVLVLDAQNAAVTEEDYVQVTGTVRRFDIASLEEELSTDLDDALYEDFEGDLVLVAQSVQPTTPAAPVDPATPGDASTTTTGG